MDYTKIRELLKKYWAAESDVAEETYLKDFFTSNADVPEDMFAEKHLFMTYQQEANFPELNEDLTGRLKVHLNKKTSFIRRRAFKYAAVLLPLVALSYILFQNKSNPDSPLVIEKTITDEKQAIKEANTALLMLSENMKDGLANVKELNILKDIGNELNEKADQNIVK